MYVSCIFYGEKYIVRSNCDIFMIISWNCIIGKNIKYFISGSFVIYNESGTASNGLFYNVQTLRDILTSLCPVCSLPTDGERDTGRHRQSVTRPGQPTSLTETTSVTVNTRPTWATRTPSQLRQWRASRSRRSIGCTRGSRSWTKTAMTLSVWRSSWRCPS